MKPLDKLVESLSEEMPTTKGNEHRVRDLMSFAESYGATIAGQQKTLSIKLANDEEKAYREIRDSELKLTADEKKAIVASKVAGVEAEVDYYKSLEKLIKQRCSIGQSFLKTLSMEGGDTADTATNFDSLANNI